MKKIALYVRVSTEYQVDKDSLPFQRKELKNYCKHILHNENYEIYEDAGKSAKNTKRAAYERMLEDIKSQKISHVIVYKIDRISRNLIDFSLMYKAFKDYGIIFISLNEQFDTSSAMGEAMLKIIMIFAELERNMTSERVKAVMINRAKEGKWNGANVPLGYTWNSESKYPIVCDEADTIRLIFDMYERVKSSASVRTHLNKNAIKTKRGGMWTSKTVSDIIRNPFYKGTLRYNYRDSARGKIKNENEWVIIDNNHEAIISEEQWEYCNNIMDQNVRMKDLSNVTRCTSKNIHIFRRLLKCYTCNSTLNCDTDRRPRLNGMTISYYKCPSRRLDKKCEEGGHISDIRLCPFIFNYLRCLIIATNNSSINKPTLLSILTSSKYVDIKGIDGLDSTICIINRNSAEYCNTISFTKSNTTIESEEAYLHNKIIKQERALSRLKQLYLFSEEIIDKKEYLAEKRNLEREMIEFRKQLNDLKAKTDEAVPTESFFNKASEFILLKKLSTENEIVYNDLYNVTEKETLYNFMKSVIDHIVIKNDKIHSITFLNKIKHTFIY